MIPLIVAPLAGIVALVAAAFLARTILKAPAGEPRMVEISDAIKSGAMAYMNRQYKTIAAVAAVLVAVFLAVTFTRDTGAEQTEWVWTTAGFVVGALFSAIAGYIGMNISVRANVRTANAARGGLAPALKIAFNGGAVSGLAVAGLALLGVSGFYYLFNDYLGMADPVTPLIGFAFGASLISLFARVGGGIYTKAADVGADLVGKVEAGIPEDDPRNPAVIAIAAIFLGFLLAGEVTALVTYPLLLGAVAIFASILAIPFVRLSKPKDGEETNIMSALYKGVFVSAGLSAVGFWFVTKMTIDSTALAFLPNGVTTLDLFLATLVGMAVMVLMMFVTE